MKALTIYLMRLEVSCSPTTDPRAMRDGINLLLMSARDKGIIARAALEEVPEKPLALSDFVYMSPDAIDDIMESGQGYLDLAREVLNGVEPVTYVAGLLRELAKRL